NNIMMVEGDAKECSEKDLVAAIRVAHEAIKVQCNAQLELAKLVGGKALTKREIELPETDEEIETRVAELAKDKIYQVAKSFMAKHDRRGQFEKIEEEVIEAFTTEKGEEYVEEKEELIKEYVGKLKKKVIRQMVLDDKVRLDGRKYDEVRPIWCEVDYLPSPHGSAIFTRGETQALMSLTLGTKL